MKILSSCIFSVLVSHIVRYSDFCNYDPWKSVVETLSSGLHDFVVLKTIPLILFGIVIGGISPFIVLTFEKLNNFKKPLSEKVTLLISMVLSSVATVSLLPWLFFRLTET